MWTHISRYIAVLAAFAAFLLVNGGIAVGDKQAHTATLHFMQMCYMAAFISGAFGFMLPWQQLFRRYTASMN